MFCNELCGRVLPIRFPHSRHQQLCASGSVALQCHRVAVCRWETPYITTLIRWPLSNQSSHLKIDSNQLKCLPAKQSCPRCPSLLGGRSDLNPGSGPDGGLSSCELLLCLKGCSCVSPAWCATKGRLDKQALTLIRKSTTIAGFNCERPDPYNRIPGPWTKLSQPQSITQKGVHTDLLTAREREHWFFAALWPFLAAAFTTQQREHPFVRYFGALP